MAKAASPGALLVVLESLVDPPNARAVLSVLLGLVPLVGHQRMLALRAGVEQSLAGGGAQEVLYQMGDRVYRFTPPGGKMTDGNQGRQLLRYQPPVPTRSEDQTRQG